MTEPKKQKISLQELYAIRQRDAQQLDNIRSSIFSYSEAITESQLAKETIMSLQDGKGKIKVRIGANLFVNAEILSKESFYENIAGEFLKERTKEEALEILEKTIDNLTNKTNELRQKEAKLRNALAQYDATFQAAYKVSQQPQNNPPVKKEENKKKE